MQPQHDRKVGSPNPENLEHEQPAAGRSGPQRGPDSSVWREFGLVSAADQYRADELIETVRAKLSPELRPLMRKEEAVGENPSRQVAISFELYDRDRGVWIAPAPGVLNFPSDEQGLSQPGEKKKLATMAATNLSWDKHECERLRSPVRIYVMYDSTSPNGCVVTYRFVDSNGARESIRHAAGTDLVSDSPNQLGDDEDSLIQQLRLKPRERYTHRSRDQGDQDERFSVAKTMLEKAVRPLCGVADYEKPPIVDTRLSSPWDLKVTIELPSASRRFPETETVKLHGRCEDGALEFAPAGMDD